MSETSHWDYLGHKPNDAFKGGGSDSFKKWARMHRDLAILRARLAGRSCKEVAGYWGLSASRVPNLCAETRWKLSLKGDYGSDYGYRIPEYDPTLVLLTDV